MESDNAELLNGSAERFTCVVTTSAKRNSTSSSKRVAIVIVACVLGVGLLIALVLGAVSITRSRALSDIETSFASSAQRTINNKSHEILTSIDAIRAEISVLTNKSEKTGLINDQIQRQQNRTNMEFEEKLFNFRRGIGAALQNQSSEMDRRLAAIQQTINERSISAIISSSVQPQSPVSALSCRPDWIEWEQRCYKIVVEAMVSWHDALSLCRESGAQRADLASIHSQEETEFVFHKTWSRPGHELSLLWLGLTRHESRSPFTWSDGSIMDYTNWMGQAPDTIVGDDCGGMHLFEDFQAQWNNHQCNLAMGYVCKADRELLLSTPALPMTTLVAGVSCLPDWMEWEDHCYLMVEHLHEAWPEAQASCRTANALHSDLISIESEEESEFVYANYGTTLDFALWIGFRRLAGAQQFQWSDGAQLNFTDWLDIGHFGNWTVTDGCALMLVHPHPIILRFWVENDCTERFGYVCKADKGRKGNEAL